MIEFLGYVIGGALVVGGLIAWYGYKGQIALRFAKFMSKFDGLNGR